MNNGKFRVVPLDTEVADAARRAVRSGAGDHRLVIADEPNGFPCRHCLHWAEPGERMILFPFPSIPAGHPYAESGPIFVHEDPCQRYEETARYPQAFRQGRVFRGYNSNFDMIDAQSGNDASPETVVEKMLRNPETAFVDARSADRGCFTFRMERA